MSVVAISLLAPACVVAALDWEHLRSGWEWLRTRRRRLGVELLRQPWAEDVSHDASLISTHGVLDVALHISKWRHWRPRHYLVALALAAALCASLTADLGAAIPFTRPVAQWWWITSIALVLISAMLTRKQWYRLQFHASLFWRAALADGAALLILAAGALALRLPYLEQVPYVVHGDEAACGLEALRWLHGDVTSLIDVGWYGLPVGGYGIPALVMRVAGVNLYGLRLSSVLIGVLSILCAYALAREFVGRRPAFVAAALLTVAHAHVHFSRVGIHYMHALCVVVLTLWLLARALRRASAPAAVLAGIGMGLAIQVYFSARILFVIVPLFLLGLTVLARHLLRERWHIVGWFLLSAVVSLGPLAIFFLRDPVPLQSRTQDVFIFASSADMHAHLVSQFGTAALGTVLQRQLAAVPLLAGGLTDQSLQYGPHTALLDPLVAALATIGFLYALLHPRRPLHLLLVIWVSSTILLGDVLTVDQPWWPRLIVMLPALCILAALALEKLIDLVGSAYLSLIRRIMPRVRWQQLQAMALTGTLALAVIVSSGVQSWQHYFVDYQRMITTDAYRTRFTDIGDFVAQFPADTYVILFTQDDITLDYNTIRFLAPDLRGQTVHTSADVVRALGMHQSRDHVVIMITASARADFTRLLMSPGALPAGVYRHYVHPTGVEAFDTYQVTR